MDARMPGMGGLEACRQITMRHPDVLVVLASVDVLQPDLARECGAAAVARKQDLSPRLLTHVWRLNAASLR
jgi:CheY-like chemotaxis protein